MTTRSRPAAASAAVAAWSGLDLLAALTSATNQLQAHLDHVNELNVFPVPDGDTGTNMDLTMRAALEEAEKLPPALRVHAGEVANRLAYGSLMGARGNSGVILSQIFRGFAREVAGHTEIAAPDLARALNGARELAYKAVMDPVEGTMLTVIRVAAEQATRLPIETATLAAVAETALLGAESALKRTPFLLDRLMQAGVVDAGGQGIVHLLHGIDRYAQGEPVTADAARRKHGSVAGIAFLDHVEELHGADAYGYCTNFMIFGAGIPYEQARAEIAAMGKSAVIGGDDRIVKVHIHTDDPGCLLSYAVRLGELGQIKIDNLNSQVHDVTERRAQAGPDRAPVDHGDVALLTVASGAGLTAALRDSGATEIIEGGKTMNPSIEQLLAAVENAAAADVILLPNNPNILLAASQVPGLSRKRVAVVPSRSIPQGMAALQAFNPDAEFNANVAKMSKAVTRPRTVEITRADRDAVIDGLTVVKGQFIALVDDKLHSAGDDHVAVTSAALLAAGAVDAELITIFTGDGQTPAGASDLEEALAGTFPDAAFEFYDGGQPHYRYVIAVE